VAGTGRDRGRETRPRADAWSGRTNPRDSPSSAAPPGAGRRAPAGPRPRARGRWGAPGGASPAPTPPPRPPASGRRPARPGAAWPRSGCGCGAGRRRPGCGRPAAPPGAARGRGRAGPSRPGTRFVPVSSSRRIARDGSGRYPHPGYRSCCRVSSTCCCWPAAAAVMPTREAAVADVGGPGALRSPRPNRSAIRVGAARRRVGAAEGGEGSCSAGARCVRTRGKTIARAPTRYAAASLGSTSSARRRTRSGSAVAKMK
jgi:hypothetical protein